MKDVTSEHTAECSEFSSGRQRITGGSSLEANSGGQGGHWQLACCNLSDARLTFSFARPQRSSSGPVSRHKAAAERFIDPKAEQLRSQPVGAGACSGAAGVCAPAADGATAGTPIPASSASARSSSANNSSAVGSRPKGKPSALPAVASVSCSGARAAGREEQLRSPTSRKLNPKADSFIVFDVNAIVDRAETLLERAVETSASPAARVVCSTHD